MDQCRKCGSTDLIQSSPDKHGTIDVICSRCRSEVRRITLADAQWDVNAAWRKSVTEGLKSFSVN